MSHIAIREELNSKAVDGMEQVSKSAGGRLLACRDESFGAISRGTDTRERNVDLGVTDKVRPLIAAVRAMVRDEIMPLEEEYEAEVGRDGDRFKPTARMVEIRESLKAKARARNLWNFWLTASDKGYGLTTVEYAYLAEEMGWSPLAS